MVICLSFLSILLELAQDASCLVHLSIGRCCCCSGRILWQLLSDTLEGRAKGLTLFLSVALQLLEELGITLLSPWFIPFLHRTETDRLIEVSLTFSIVFLVTLIGHSDLNVFRWCFIFRIYCADTKVFRSPSCLFW